MARADHRSGAISPAAAALCKTRQVYGQPASDRVRRTRARSVPASWYRWRFANQPNTTETGQADPRWSAEGRRRHQGRDLRPHHEPDRRHGRGRDPRPRVECQRGKLVGGVANAVGGVATFPDLSIDTPGSFWSRSASATADTSISDQFMVADTVAMQTAPTVASPRPGTGTRTRPQQKICGRQMGQLRQPAAGRGDFAPSITWTRASRTPSGSATTTGTPDPRRRT